MKKEMAFLVAGILLMSFVVAQVQGGRGVGQDVVVAARGQEGSPIQMEGIRMKVMAGNYVGEGGQQMMIQTQANNRMQLRVNGISADCGLNLTQTRAQNRTKLETKLSNGRNAEIKIMPNVASGKALERLRLKNCVEGECSIELKEVGAGERMRLAYEVKTERRSKFLGLFGMRMNVEVQVDAESGEVIRVRKPWWAFLASES